MSAVKPRLCALGLALLLSLTACGGEKAPTQDDPPPETPPSAPTVPIRQEKKHDPFGGTYWTAVRWELDAEYKDASDLPTEDRWADLWLNEDGSVLYREVQHRLYNAELHGGQWQAGGLSPRGGALGGLGQRLSTHGHPLHRRKAGLLRAGI